MKKFYCLFIVLFVCMSIMRVEAETTHSYYEGFCSECGEIQDDYLSPIDDWYEIHNAAELTWWSHYAAIHLGTNARLMNDIDMEGYSNRYATIGTEGAPFYGNFDGQFHTISNLVINKAETRCVGLIAVMNSLPSANQMADGTFVSDNDANDADGVFVKNIIIDTTCSFSGYGYVGVVGMTDCWSGHVCLSNIMMNGNVTANGGANAAGILGCAKCASWPYGPFCHVSIENCGMTGNVYGSKENGSISGWLGGYAEVRNCFSIGEVTGIESTNQYFARHIGEENGGKVTFSNCYSKYGTQVYQLSDEDVNSGVLTWMLNGEQYRSPHWFQNIGVDKYPYTSPSHGVVIFAAGQFFSVASEEDLAYVIKAIQDYENRYLIECTATPSQIADYIAMINALDSIKSVSELANALNNLYASKQSIHGYVNLGLPSGTLWATCNVGGSSPEDYGDFYAWGETTTKNTFTPENYSFTGNRIDVLHDAATVKWGSDWKMPTLEQMEELINPEYTILQEYYPNGRVGLLVTSKINGQSLFLPSAGCYAWYSSVAQTNNLWKERAGNYWTTALSNEIEGDAICLVTTHEGILARCPDPWDSRRWTGRSIRPVRVNDHNSDNEGNDNYATLTYNAGEQSTLQMTVKKGNTTLSINTEENWIVETLTVNKTDKLSNLTDGKLIVNVEADTEVKVTFCWANADNLYTEDYETGIATIQGENVKVYVIDGQLCIDGAFGKEVRLYTTGGVLIKTIIPQDSNKIGIFSVPIGTYIVQVGQKAAKIEIK